MKSQVAKNVNMVAEIARMSAPESEARRSIGICVATPSATEAY